MLEMLVLKIQGPLALLVVELDPKRSEKYLQKKNGRWLIYYVKHNKAFYRTLDVAILAYQKLVGFLDKCGFKQKFYEPFCWNSIIKGAQYKIIFHLDDVKASHINPSVVTNFIIV